MSEEASARKGISAATLKWIALITMTIDHFAASGLFSQLAYGMVGWRLADQLYMLLRIIGRLAFPIYCFLLAEGFRYTRSRERYALRLGLFALISEIPFDLAACHVVWDWNDQNVFFTLLFGLLALMLADPLYEKGEQRKAFFIVLGFALAAELLRTDYGFFGVAVIAAMHFLREQTVEKYLITAGLLMGASTLEVAALPAFGLMHCYNGRQGRQSGAMRLLFYWYYPLHLLVFGLAVRWLG